MILKKKMFFFGAAFLTGRTTYTRLLQTLFQFHTSKKFDIEITPNICSLEKYLCKPI